MRRRLWWSLLIQDSRAGEDHGITIDRSYNSFDTELPLNVDDKELYPNMKVLPVHQARWTEMTFNLIGYEINKVHLRMYRPLQNTTQTSMDELSREKEIYDLTQRHENTYLKYCDVNMPMQLATLLAGRSVRRKCGFVLRQYDTNRGDLDGRAFHDKEDSFTTSRLKTQIFMLLLFSFLQNMLLFND